MLALVRSFPSLRGYPAGLSSGHAEYFDAAAFEFWARGAWATSGSINAARFVMEVWNGGERNRGKLLCDWKIGLFSVREAMCSWDAAHRAAFLEFCGSPFWP